MKGIQGLIIAIVLGTLGSLVNMYYLTKGRDMSTQRFIGVVDGAEIEVGEKFKQDDLEAVEIPTEHARSLRKYAIPYSEINSILGFNSRRQIDGQQGELLLRTDVRTPTEMLDLESNQAAISVLVNPTTTSLDQIIPQVTPISFYLPIDRTSGRSDGAWEWFGPFDVLAVGNRLGRADAGGRRGSSRSRNMLTLQVQFTAGKINPKIAELKKYVHRTNNEPLDVMIHTPR
ncbi:MAG: hypothetical protein WBF93_09070 [Pirellulales bacterium]|nr:hypothetical protein [Pirellulales bacterium]